MFVQTAHYIEHHKKNGKQINLRAYGVEKIGATTALNENGRAALVMANNINSFWVFIYECLPKSCLKDYWKFLKNNGVTFVNI